MKKELIIILLLLAVSFPAVKALLQSGGYTSHDLTHHVIRQISMDKLLSEGQFPPRWSADLNNGYGYPVFLFNYPLPAILGEVFHKIGLGFVDSVKAVLFISMIASILGMYLFLKELLGSRLAAFLGACFYLYAPIRFLNVYVSVAVGSALALGILPFIFWTIIKLAKTGSGIYLLLGSLFLAALIIAHNVTTLIFTPVVVLFTALLIWRSKERIRVLRQIGTMVLLGLGLSAWFWIPATFEKQYIHFDQIYSGFYKEQFVSLWQLLRSPWGYGLSHPQNPESGDMSYQLGLVHILIMILSVPVLWFMRKNREIRAIGGFALFFFILSLVLMLRISSPIWDKLPFLSLVQFPLRFQAISIFSASIAAALLVKYLPNKLILFVILLILVIYANRNHWRINQVFDPGEEYYLALKTTTASYDEHLPKWARAMKVGSSSKLEFVNNEGNITIIENKSAKVLAQVEATSLAKMRFNQFYFPGWEIKVDEKLVDFNYLVEGESYGLPIFDIAPGVHQVRAEFTNTSIRSVADGISLISVVIWVSLSLRGMLMTKR